MSITVCTVSGKGGTGKSTVSSGLAIAANNLGKKVLMIDLDAGLRCLDMIFGIDDKIVFDLSDALSDMDPQKAIYPAAEYENISIIPAPADYCKIDFVKLYELVREVRDDYDFIFLDFPAGLDFEGYEIFSSALFLVVSGCDAVSSRDAYVMSSVLKGNVVPRLILNRFDADMISCGIYGNIDKTIDTALIRLIGIVPADGELLTLSKYHKLKPKGRAIKALDRIIKRISGEDVPLPDPKKI